MLDRLFGYTIHPFLQLMGLIILGFGLPMNKVLMSIGTIWLASNIILKADFKSYAQRLKESKLAWFIIAILLLHLIGLLYTDDFGYAFRDLNTKLPLFAVPLALIVYPIKKTWIKFPMISFVLSLLITSSINTYTDWVNPQADFRSISLFGSHIRYTILIVMGIVASLYIIQQRMFTMWMLIPVIGWFIFYVYRSQVFAGYVSVFMLALAVLIYFSSLIQQKGLRVLTFSTIIVALVGSIIFSSFYFFPESSQYDFGDLPKKTANGHLYHHDTTFMWFENGEHVMSYISEIELKKEWNQRSEIDYDSLDINGHEVKATLIRYMTSKGLKKDAEGMAKMTTSDIKNVEKGYTNIRQVNHSPLARIETVRNEITQYVQTGDPNGNSFIERMEHVKVGLAIIKDHWLIGVGTGDVQQIFNDYYQKTNSKLHKEHWNRTHNQFLTFWITFGVVGFIVFIALWFWLFKTALSLRSFFVLSFTLIAVGSFLSEDTIETQQGVTFIAFFLGISHLIAEKLRNRHST